LIGTHANEELRGFDAIHDPLGARLDPCRAAALGGRGGPRPYIHRHCVVRLREIVDKGDAVLIEIEKSPAIELVIAAREAVRDHDRMRQRFVLRLQACLDRDDGRLDRRLS